MSFCRRPDYKSDATLFIEQLKGKNKISCMIAQKSAYSIRLILF